MFSIFNNDETPQFISYGIDGTSAGLVYAGKGDQCQKMEKENRECVTINPFVSFSGKITKLLKYLFYALKWFTITIHIEALMSINNLYNFFCYI